MVVLVVSINASWNKAEDDTAVLEVVSQWGNWLESTAEERGLLRKFLYMNYADASQPVYENSLTPEDLARMKEIQAEYDPDLALRTLAQGGFKLPA